ncbi:MAG: hypothetical protein ABJG51_01760 [Nonlabens ulvanivorans]|uniref:hypothetical protein n=1 Tax=Nonlabens ulvanivorans TaxID=906888 RepID=UPI0032651B5F
MGRHLNLIWDFKGPDAQRTAQHHFIHLEEFIVRDKIASLGTGVEKLNENHFIAFMGIEEAAMPPVRDALKPHRGQLWIS